jgi:hypothetical protein
LYIRKRNPEIGEAFMLDHSRKQVKAVVEIGPNYAFHLMAVARVGFDSEYADKYRGTVLPDDLEMIKKYGKDLIFGGGSSSEIIGPLIAWPAYLNLDSPNALSEYFNLLDESLKGDDFKPFLDHYASRFRKLEKWWYSLTPELLKMFIPERDLIKSLGGILTRNIDTYINSVWAAEKPAMIETAEYINGYFGAIDRIGQWEEITGRVFEFDIYEIVLCSAIKNGNDANSLGYDRVIFYSGTERESITEFISHEIGTHILIGMLKEVARINKFEFPALYEAYELLARYYNTIILNRSPLSYAMSNFRVEEYLIIFKRLHESEPDLSPKDLLISGIESFMGASPS